MSGTLAAVPAEVRAVREAAGLAAVAIGALRLTGPDRKKFLQGLLTADVLALQPGGWTKAYLLTPKGRLVAELAVYDLGDELLTLQRPAATAPLAQGLSKSIILTETKLETLEVGALAALGEDAGRIAASVGGDASRCGRAAWKGRDLFVCPVPFWPRAIAIVWAGARPEGLEEALLAAAPGAARIGEPTLEALRVEAGIPAFGADTDAETFPLELGEEGISFDKGCYLGQETTGKMKNLGHSNRRLVRLRLEGPAPDGAELHAGAERVGRLGSVARMPEATLALGLVKHAHAAAGVQLSAGSARASVL